MDPYNHSTPTSTKLLILDTGKFEQWKFRIQQYLQHEHYDLWEVIELGDSYKAPPEETGKGLAGEGSAKKKGKTVAITAEDMQKRKNDVKAITTQLLALLKHHLLGNQRLNKDKKSLGFNEYSVVPPPPAQVYSPPKKDLSWMGLPEFVDDTVTDYSMPTPSVDVSKDVSASSLEQGGSFDNVVSKPIIRFVKETGCPSVSKDNNTENPRKPTVKVMQRCTGTPHKSLKVREPEGIGAIKRSQQRRYEKTFVMQNKACYNCGSFEHLKFDCKQNIWVDKGKTWSRVNHDHDNMKYPSKPTLNCAHSKMTSLVKPAHSHVKRPFVRKTAVKNKVWVPTVRTKFPTVGPKVPTAKPTVAADKGNRGKAVKAPACWIWKPKQNQPNQGSNLNGVSVIFKKYKYIDTQGRHKIILMIKDIGTQQMVSAGNLILMLDEHVMMRGKGTSRIRHEATVSPTRDDRHGEAFPTATSLDAGQDRENIAKTSAMPHEASPRVTSLVCDGKSLVLKNKVKTLEDNAKRSEGFAQEDAPNTGGMDQRCLSTLGAANVLSSGGTASTPAGVDTASGSFPTAVIFTTASVTTPYTRRTRALRGIIIESSQTTSVPIISAKGKGKEKMAESESTKKKKVQEQLDAQVAKELEYEFAQEEQLIREQGEKYAKIARVQAERELGLWNLAEIKRYQAQQSKPATKTEKRNYYMSILKSNAGWKAKASGSEPSQEQQTKDPKELSKEELKKMMEIVPVEEIYIDALQAKYPIIDWEIYSKE
ncbi:ribonuclease H-like domain-containing protein [Tanacetum coccineum]|uniref:Ribonuclease H-like domain-containing protein n=1 Tax=Tanacetum coccineum TaxID=301880 RepID=A0ABQ5HNZ5_9ASTR